MTREPNFPRLAVRPDPQPGVATPYYAIVSPLPLHPGTMLQGHLRRHGERHAGMYAYRLLHWLTAARVAHNLAALPADQVFAVQLECPTMDKALGESGLRHVRVCPLCARRYPSLHAQLNKVVLL